MIFKNHIKNLIFWKKNMRINYQNILEKKINQEQKEILDVNLDREEEYKILKKK